MLFHGVPYKVAEERPPPDGEQCCSSRPNTVHRLAKTSITFSEQDLKLESYPHTDAMVIKANIAG
jgi:hypothetical protein